MRKKERVQRENELVKGKEGAVLPKKNGRGEQGEGTL